MAQDDFDDELDGLGDLDDSFENADDFEEDFGDGLDDFEDLSQTVDMDDDELEDSTPAESSASAPEKKRSWIGLVASILIGSSLGGVALWWFFIYRPADLQYVADLIPQLSEEQSSDESDDSMSMALEDTLEGLQLDELSPSDPTTVMRPLPPEPSEAMEVPEEEKPAIAPPPVKPKPKLRYWVQVARCIDQECIEDYRFLLKRYGIRASVVAVVERTPVHEVVSSNTFTDHQASQWVRQINHRHQWSGQAYRKADGGQFRISMGTFPVQETAEHVQNRLNHQFLGELKFEMNKTTQRTRYHQVRTQSFNSKTKALSLHEKLVHEDERFFKAQVISSSRT